MATPPGYASVSLKLQHSSLARAAYLTYGCNPTSSDPAVVANSIVGCWLGPGSLNTKLDSSVTMTEVTVRLGTDGGEDLVGSATSTATGVPAYATPPPNVAILVHKRTARGGRRGRGRFFLPWMVQANDVGETGNLLAATRTALETACNAFRTLHATDPGPIVLLHRPGLTSSGPPDVVTAMQVMALVATQRRRLGR